MKKLMLMLWVLALLTACAKRTAEPVNGVRLFSFENEYTYPGDPDFVYQHLTGDISGWWDHTFSNDPLALYIEAKPGGGFYEIFDASGDGVLHATVIGAEKGRMLRMEGPLGLAGQAITMVTTYQLEPAGGDSTRLTLSLNASGEIGEGIPEIVEQVWHHFLWEQFKPYIDSVYNHRP